MGIYKNDHFGSETFLSLNPTAKATATLFSCLTLMHAYASLFKGELSSVADFHPSLP